MNTLRGYAREYVDFEKSDIKFPVPNNKKSIIFMNQTDCLEHFFRYSDHDASNKNAFFEATRGRYELLDYNGLYDVNRMGEYIWDTPKIERLLLDVNNAIEDIELLLKYKDVPEIHDKDELEKCYYSAYEYGETIWFNLPSVADQPDMSYFGKEGLRQWLAGMKFLCEDCLKKNFVLYINEN
jgi:hypothetical protein